MPRYKFSWGNLPRSLLDQLTSELGFAGEDPVSELRGYYGARPKPNFIQDAWPSLMTHWLAVDPSSREWVVDDLRAAGLGQPRSSLRSKADQLEYLATCRNAKSLREIVLTVFLVAGEPEQVTPPSIRQASTLERRSSPPQQSPSPVTTSTPADTPEPDETETETDLDTWVEDTVGRIFGIRPRRDRDGDIPIPRGSSVLYVRPHDSDSPFLEIFAPLLNNFQLTPAVYEAINSINTKVPLAKTSVNGDGRLITMSAMLFADDVSARSLATTIELVSGAADHFDSLLQKRFGGQTALEDDDDGIEI